MKNDFVHKLDFDENFHQENYYFFSWYQPPPKLKLSHSSLSERTFTAKQAISARSEDNLMTTLSWLELFSWNDGLAKSEKQFEFKFDAIWCVCTKFSRATEWHFHNLGVLFPRQLLFSFHPCFDVWKCINFFIPFQQTWIGFQPFLAFWNRNRKTKCRK